MIRKTIRVAINGFGRIGRAFFRICLKDPFIDIVMINDAYLIPDTLAYLCKYDSVYGVLPNDVSLIHEHLVVDGKKILLYQSQGIETLPLNDYGVDVLVYASGDLAQLDFLLPSLLDTSYKAIFTTHLKNEYISPFIYGTEKPDALATLKVVSLSTCDANAVLPIYQFLSSTFGIESASVVTLHPYLSSQNLLDGKSPSHEMELGRSAINTLIPKATSLEHILKEYFPHDKKSLMAMSFRVPTSSVASAIMHFQFQRMVDPETLKARIAEWCRTVCTRISLFTIDNCVSIDYMQSHHSFIIPGKFLNCVENQVRIIAWYDNEWGYASRIYDCLRDFY